MYDAVSEAFPDASASLIGKALGTIREKDPDATPAQVAERAAWVKAKFDVCTPAALAKHWIAAGGALARKPRRVDWDAVAEADYERLHGSDG